MRLEIKNDLMPWNKRVDLVRRMQAAWLCGSEFPMASRLELRLALQFIHEPDRVIMVHGWAKLRRVGK